MNTLKIALLQLIPGATLSENLKKGMEACKKAKCMGQILLCSLKCGAMGTIFMIVHWMNG